MGNWFVRRWESVVGGAEDAVDILHVAGNQWFGDGQYLPQVYKDAEKVMAKRLPANATQEQINQASLEAHQANVNVQQATADYQNAALMIAASPTVLLSGPALAIGRTAGAAGFIVRNGVRIGVPAVVGMGLENISNRVFNAASKGNIDLPADLDALEKAKIKTLIRTGGNELSAADLDRDGDGVLTQNDLKAIREKLGDELTDKLVKTWSEQGVTFDGKIQIVSAAAAGASAGQSAGTTPYNPGGTEPGILDKIVTTISGAVSGIVDFFKNLFNKNVDTSGQTQAGGAVGGQPIENPRQPQPAVVPPPLPPGVQVPASGMGK